MIHLYLRVSTTEQAEHGKSSLDDQERRARGAAMMRGEQAIKVHTDIGISGGVPIDKRPAGGAMMKQIQPGDLIIAAKMDRMFRSASDAINTTEALQKQQVGVILADIGPDPVTENGVSKMFFTILAAVAEFEKTRIAERMEDGRRGKRAKGGHTGGQPPYGYTVEGTGALAKLVADEAEQETIKDAKRLYAKGRSYRDIATLLMKRGKLARNGKPFASTQVMRMLKSQSKRVGETL